MGFRIHLPSRIVYHNAPSKRVERGNILTWEQTLSDRRAGKPIEMSVDMDATSILNTTLWLFGGEVIRSFVFAMLFGIVIGTYSSIFVAGPLLILFKLRIAYARYG